MTWRAIHRYGDGQFSMATNSGERRAPSPAEAREIALELERFADEVESTRRPTITGTDFLSAGHLVDPDADFALFRDKNHSVVAVIQVPGWSSVLLRAQAHMTSGNAESTRTTVVRSPRC